METFALVKFEECFPSRFVMPWLIGITLSMEEKIWISPSVLPVLEMIS